MRSDGEELRIPDSLLDFPQNTITPEDLEWTFGQTPEINFVVDCKAICEIFAGVKTKESIALFTGVGCFLLVFLFWSGESTFCFRKSIFRSKR